MVSEDNMYVRKLASICRDVNDHYNIGECFFSADDGFLYEKGTPVVFLGPGKTSQAHQLNEHIDIKEIMKCAEIYCKFIVQTIGN